MRIASYNPMSMLQAGRWDDLAVQFKSIHVIAVIGTQLSTEHEVEQHRTGNFQRLDWGRGDRSTGVSLLLRRDVFPRSCVRKHFTPPESLKGRVGGVRVRTGCMHVALFAVYIPPCDGAKQSGRVASDIFLWLSAIIDGLPHRCVPVMCMDANAHIGKEKFQVYQAHACLLFTALWVALTGRCRTRMGHCCFNSLRETGFVWLTRFFSVWGYLLLKRRKGKEQGRLHRSSKRCQI